MPDISELLAAGTPPPQVDTPTVAYAKALALRNEQQQQQQGAQQLQMGALNLQQARRDANDQDVMRQSMMDAQGDPNKALQLAISRGASPKAVIGLQGQLLDMRTKLAALDKDTLDNTAKAHDAMRGSLNAYINNPSMLEKTNGWSDFMQQQVDAKHITPAEAAPYASYPGDEQAQRIANSLATGSVLAKEEIDARTADARKTTAATGAAKQTIEAPGQIADATQKQVTALAPQLEAAFKQGGPQAVGAVLDQQPYGIAKRFASAAKAGDFTAAALTPEQTTTATQAALNAQNTEADRKVTQGQNLQRIFIEGKNADINAKKFALEFGGNAVQGWAKQVEQNPDTANQVPAGLRTSVMQQFTQNTGLAFPKPLAGTAVDQERASRNALDAVSQIQDALKDPDIQSSLGPIMGRLGDVQQDMGTSLGLSPAAAQKAQQLRTNMRYLVFQEGKALLGGRMPQKLMEALESSSPSVKMDAPTMQGAMAGVSDAANRNLDQTFKQRFGAGSTRPGAAPATGGAPPPFPAKLSQSDVGKTYTNKDGKAVTIKAVSPDGKSFQ
jgi:hypothetical protein